MVVDVALSLILVAYLVVKLQLNDFHEMENIKQTSETVDGQFGQCAAIAWSFESFCDIGSPRHLLVALCFDVGSPCVHLRMLGVRGCACKCVCVCGQY